MTMPLTPSGEPAGRAACRDHDPELWFPNGTGPHYHAQIQQAKSICNTCPVRPACAQLAIETGEAEGVWGGLDPSERRGVRRRQGQYGRRRDLSPCGTLAAYRRHLRREEIVCDLCRESARISKQTQPDTDAEAA
jgi:WhiB family redox-sensing transcriptional regulator